MTPKNPEAPLQHGEPEPEAIDAVELAEAEALARVLESETGVTGRGTAVSSASASHADALAEPWATAQLITSVAEGRAREAGEAARVLARAEAALRSRAEKILAPEAPPTVRAPRRKAWWLLFVPALGVPALGAWIFVLETSRRAEPVSAVVLARTAVELPPPAPSLLAAQARAVHGSRQAWEELERETRDYRERVFAVVVKEEPSR